MVSVRKHLYLAGWIVDYLLNKKPLENAKTQNPLEARIDPDMDYYNIGAFTYIFSLLEEIKLQSYYLIIGGEEKLSKRQVEPLEKIRETFLKDDQIEKVENLNLFIKRLDSLNKERKRIMHGCWSMKTFPYKMIKSSGLS